MISNTASDHGSHRSEGSISGAAVLAALIPALVTAFVYLAVFAAIRNTFRKIYAPRTYLGTVAERDRTPQSSAPGLGWLRDFCSLPDNFVLRHNSLDAYLYLRFLRFIAFICFLGVCMVWPILLPINATGGGDATQLDRISFSNVAHNDRLWAHLVVAWGFFIAVVLLVVRERLQLIGIRQAYLLDEHRAARLSSRTVLFLNVPPEACQPGNAKQHFGDEAETCWPVRDVGDLDDLVSRRNGAAFQLERIQTEHVISTVKSRRRRGGSTAVPNGSEVDEGRPGINKAQRPSKRNPPFVGSKYDPVQVGHSKIGDLVATIDAHRVAPGRSVPQRSAMFVSFCSQAAAHRAHQRISFPPPMPLEDRFLDVQPKEVLWRNLAMPATLRLSKASLGLGFVIAFTIFFSIPVGIIGTISNAKYLAEHYQWLAWINDLPPVVLGLLTGLVPPFLTSWFTSYVPKLFRHIAKLSGEPTTSQAELKTQAWYFVFQVFQIFLITTFSSGAAAVAAKIIAEPHSAPRLLAESLPKASNFYLTYFILQGTASAANTILNYSDLFEYLFYEYFWDRSPRDKFATYSKMKGTPWASWFPKFTTFLVIAIAYACVAPLVLGFAAVGLYLCYLTYRHQLLYVCQTKIDTKGEAYKRALQQIPTGIYLAELCLIGLFGARGAAALSVLMIATLVATALLNLVLDRVLRPLELYLGVDIWQEREVPELAAEDGIPHDDTAALHAASHGRRLGLKRLPNPVPRLLSDLFDGVISAAREKAETTLHGHAAEENADFPPIEAEEMEKIYKDPAFTSTTPKLWIPRDGAGASRLEIEQNDAVGLPTTDEAAEVDDEGRLRWDHRFENVPVWKKARAV